MSVLAYVLPIVVILIGVSLGFTLARHARYRALGILFLVAGAGFWLCVELAEGQEEWAGIGYAIMALLVILPWAGGLVIGLVIGAVRRWREGRAHG